MDFKQLESFITIAKLKSFSKAAEKLYLTQPTISNHIHILEKELGTILLNRSNKNVTLTSAGEILYKYSISILNKRDHAYFALDQFKGKIEGILEISSSTIPEQYFLTDVLYKFNKLYPEVKYSLHRFDSTKVVERILLGDIDFGIVGAKKDNNQLEYIEIFQDEIVLVAPNNDKFFEIDELEIEDLIEHKYIFRENGSGTRNKIEEYLSSKKIDVETLDILGYVENNETIKKLVEMNMGIAFLSKLAVKKELENSTLKEIRIDDFKIQRSFYFVYHKSRVLSPLAETFKSFIIDKNYE
ncbi:MAG: selenium metabolism-associated LysR family transcriptional regulator [Firmicutes bacterium]|jgi:DNA-binding transcriptional LysR family regulator|nr:selenium metabolism-associated LysR family transcriptional regulator [Bacillota bacterium]